MSPARAQYSQIEATLFTEEWFVNLSKAGKVLYLYLRLCLHRHFSGLYEITDRVLVFDTGMEKAELAVTFDELELCGQVRRDGTTVWVVEELKRRPETGGYISEKLAFGAVKQWARFNDQPLAAEFMAYYRSRMPEKVIKNTPWERKIPYHETNTPSDNGIGYKEGLDPSIEDDKDINISKSSSSICEAIGNQNTLSGPKIPYNLPDWLLGSEECPGILRQAYGKKYKWDELTEILVANIHEMMAQHSEEEIREACRKAGLRQAHSIGYMWTCLENGKADKAKAKSKQTTPQEGPKPTSKFAYNQATNVTRFIKNESELKDGEVLV